jgi:hypothetical protein
MPQFWRSERQRGQLLSGMPQLGCPLPAALPIDLRYCSNL